MYNPKFDDHIKKLIIVQRFFKKILLSKPIRRLLPLLVPLYYHPDAKGGYFHKKCMMKFIENINFGKTSK